MDGHVVMIPGAAGFPTPLTRDTMSPMALLMEDPELNTNELFLQGGERMIRWREFDELIAPFMQSHGAAEIVMTAQALRMPFAFVPTACELLTDDHIAERGFMAEVQHPKAGAVKQAGPPFKMSETPLVTGPAPERGSANADVLSSLGYEASDLRILSDQGVI
jgi:crotonobetainyl-CoA:carnitine CoA-transferase CaiB-like acyl-CoA transferase